MGTDAFSARREPREIEGRAHMELVTGDGRSHDLVLLTRYLSRDPDELIPHGTEIGIVGPDGRLAVRTVDTAALRVVLGADLCAQIIDEAHRDAQDKL